MKKVLIVLCLAITLVTLLVPFVSADVLPGLEVAYFSNAYVAEGADYDYFGLFVPGTPDFASGIRPDKYNLIPGQYYYLNQTPFRADANGLIPNGTVFTTDSEIFIVEWYTPPGGDSNQFYGYYNLLNGRTGAIYYPSRYRAFSVYIASGESGLYNDGYTKGYEDGYNAAYNIAERVGYDNGFNAGRDVGFNEGRKQGYRDGLETADNSEWTDLFTAVVEAPVNVLYGMFDFNLLGLDMKMAVGAILTLCVVLIVVKAVV